jgi:acyl dehydratase
VPIDPDRVGAATDPHEVTWTSRDSLIYALGVGVGADVDDLAYSTDNTAGVDQRALPTMPVVLTRDARALKLVGDIDWARLVHAEQQVTLAAPLPVEGRATAVSRVESIYDKGRAALVTIITDGTDTAMGTPLFCTASRMFIHGAGGWGGDRGPPTPQGTPTGPPDTVVRQRTHPEQALLYRLSGDRNRLHSDPAFAARAGYERPILHGLCTYGFAGRALLATVCGGDPARFATMRGRFIAPVTPGDELATHIWYDGDNATFQTLRGDGTVVIGGGQLTTRRGQD